MGRLICRSSARGHDDLANAAAGALLSSDATGPLNCGRHVNIRGVAMSERENPSRYVVDGTPGQGFKRSLDNLNLPANRVTTS